MIITALLGIYKTIESQGQGYLKGHIMKPLNYTLILSKAKIFKSHQAFVLEPLQELTVMEVI